MMYWICGVFRCLFITFKKILECKTTGLQCGLQRRHRRLQLQMNYRR